VIETQRKDELEFTSDGHTPVASLRDCFYFPVTLRSRFLVSASLTLRAAGGMTQVGKSTHFSAIAGDCALKKKVRRKKFNM